GSPFVSETAVTVRTSSYAAGTSWARSRVLLPADATYVTPLAIDAQIAWCTGSLLVLPQLPSSVPASERLRFATRMPSACALAVTQSMPQIRFDVVPLRDPSSTRT